MADYIRDEAARQMSAIKSARAKDAAAKARLEIYKKSRPWA